MKSISNTAILGVYQGECADANITNNNGLDITREVWENVFASDEYATAIEHGWYIGYLGHPEDPGYQNFSEACIVMTEGHIDDNGKVYGSFNLIDTPVGRIVKSFTDAGVKFGISVRGAGDIISNSVDPDTFVFRGFDLVAFPAFPESIPTFSKIAASSDVESQQRYKAVCAAVETNIDELNSIKSVETIQSCFAKQSDTYKKLEDRKHAIESSAEEDDKLSEDADAVEEIDEEELEKVTAARIAGLTKLYIKAVHQIQSLSADNAKLKKSIDVIKCANERKIKSLKRIMGAQLTEMDKSISDVGSLHSKAVAQNKQLKIEASKKIRAIRAKSEAEVNRLNLEINDMTEANLKYKHKIEASEQSLRDKDRIIASLETQVKKTVRDKEDILNQASNRDDMIADLRSQITATTKLLTEYQNAYANLYASATGAQLANVSITASTSTSDLRRMIERSAVTASVDIDTSDTPVDDFDSDDNVEDSLVIL